MSEESINKMKAMFKGKAEKIAEAAGQSLGEVAFKTKKVIESAAPMVKSAKSALADLGQTLSSARDSFDQGMTDAEKRAGERAAQESADKAKAEQSAGKSGSADKPKEPGL